GIILEYGLIVLLYYFMFRLLKAIYREFYVVSPNFSVSVPLIQETEGAEQAKLIVVNHGESKLKRTEFKIEDSVSIGRGDNNAIVVDETFVSHEHACITRYKHEFWLSDLTSTNGTFLNNQRVQEDVKLKSGDIITIGSASFRFER
ncbi:MAG: fhaB 14, partial [Firmicutes bacterium]|nr:fhaB 14 [Bacillota bacterium]